MRLSVTNLRNRRNVNADRVAQSQGGSMKVCYTGETSFLICTNGKVYDVLSVEKGWYRIVDDSGDDYLYPPQLFEVVEA